jgi:hypothetical protein
MEIQIWAIEKLISYARNPRKNDAAVDRMAAALREFGFKIPVLARSDGEVVDGHLRLKAARKLALKELPVILCDEWSPAQVKAFRLLVNRSANWADWDEELLALELQDLSSADIDLSLTGFDQHEIDHFLTFPEEQGSGAAPSPPENPVSGLGDLWLCGHGRTSHRVLCGDATQVDVVARLLRDNRPLLMVTDPPYGIELDSKWRDQAGINGSGSRTGKQRSVGHRETSISGDTRADWSEAFALVPSLSVAYVWHASLFTREVLGGLLKFGFEHHQQIIWDKGRTVLTRTHYWFQHEPCWYVRHKNAPWYAKAGANSTIWASPSPKFALGGSDEECPSGKAA